MSRDRKKALSQALLRVRTDSWQTEFKAELRSCFPSPPFFPFLHPVTKLTSKGPESFCFDRSLCSVMQPNRTLYTITLTLLNVS